MPAPPTEQAARLAKRLRQIIDAHGLHAEEWHGVGLVDLNAAYRVASSPGTSAYVYHTKGNLMGHGNGRRG